VPRGRHKCKTAPKDQYYRIVVPSVSISLGLCIEHGALLDLLETLSHARHQKMNVFVLFTCGTVSCVSGHI